MPGAGSLDVERGLGRRGRLSGEVVNANAAVGGQLRTFKSETCTCFAIASCRSRPVRPVRVASARAVPGFHADGIVPAPGPLRNVAGCHVLMRGRAPCHVLSRGEWTDNWSRIRLRSDLQEFLPDDRGTNLFRGPAVSCHFICQQNLLKARSAAYSVLGSITIKQAPVPDAVATAVAPAAGRAVPRLSSKVQAMPGALMIVPITRKGFVPSSRSASLDSQANSVANTLASLISP